ncbi:hypothetical protein [Bacillus cereus group sp. TH152-1LC]|uniref:hypothetical protein n=1 Tax=Bacillus cereus group sp. TH152-1LC TaxID=3018060 RepID=UPI0022E6074B|nr:hypothetical protein [Bacillus cereus group sp. TH152-1LC]MDA1675665.1 hypothetical protein [Bacillus cereus group sp. TH152-1LC]
MNLKGIFFKKINCFIHTRKKSPFSNIQQFRYAKMVETNKKEKNMVIIPGLSEEQTILLKNRLVEVGFHYMDKDTLIKSYKWGLESKRFYRNFETLEVLEEKIRIFLDDFNKMKNENRLQKIKEVCSNCSNYDYMDYISLDDIQFLLDLIEQQENNQRNI